MANHVNVDRNVEYKELSIAKTWFACSIPSMEGISKSKSRVRVMCTFSRDIVDVKVREPKTFSRYQ